MIAESISLFATIFVHLSLILAALSFMHVLEIIKPIALWHALPIFSCLIAIIFAITGPSVLPKVFLIITLLLFGATLIRSWRFIIRSVEYLEFLKMEERKSQISKD